MERSISTCFLFRTVSTSFEPSLSNLLKNDTKIQTLFCIFTSYLINCCSYLQRCFFVPNGSFQSPNMLLLVINFLLCSRKMILQSSMCLSCFSNSSSKGIIRFIPRSPHTICTFSNGWINLFSQTMRLLSSSYIIRICNTDLF